MDHYDLLVIGCGPAGRRAAVQAAKMGGKVLVADQGCRLGGVSVHTGTIPSKTLRETVLNLTGLREREFYGSHYRVKNTITTADLNARLSKTLDHEVEALEFQFNRNGVSHIVAHAKFLSPNAVQLSISADEKRIVKFSKCVIAVGTRPSRPSNVPFDGQYIVDSDQILEMTTVPRSLAVVGAGVIGIEYATIFSALDVPVTLIDERSTVLDFLDRELTGEFLHHMRESGVVTRLGCAISEIRKMRNCVEVILTNGSSIRSEYLLYAIGRIGNVEGLDLPRVGLAVDVRGRISVNKETLQTEASHIYAAGDIIGFPSLASTSMEQGRRAACHALGMSIPPVPEAFPYGIYTVPEISTVGSTEEEVRATGTAYECGVARFKETSRGHIMGVRTGFLKLIFALESRKLLGAHIVGEGATELIHIGQAVINLGGTVDYFVNSVFNYPTLAEAYKIAGLAAWNRMTKSQSAISRETQTA